MLIVYEFGIESEKKEKMARSGILSVAIFVVFTSVTFQGGTNIE